MFVYVCFKKQQTSDLSFHTALSGAMRENQIVCNSHLSLKLKSMVNSLLVGNFRTVPKQSLFYFLL